ncbi:MAG: enoyl-CoA hydratase [Actinomycetota bacterium]
MTAAPARTPGGRLDATPAHPVRIEVTEGVAVLTMSRPQVRNAIDPAMRRALRSSIADVETDDAVEVIVLTGDDPAFCAGLDLRILGAEPDVLLGDEPAAGERTARPTGSHSPFPDRTKPLIGAVNGAAITGGFELALNCDFLIASERAVFADTHARVGVMPGWGLTALLTDAVGRTRAREISLTGNFVTAEQALAWGLVNRVVAHDDLLPTVLSLAADIVDNDRAGVRRMLATYREQEQASLAEAWDLETAGASAFIRDLSPDSGVEARLEGVIDRGRRQL